MPIENIQRIKERLHWQPVTRQLWIQETAIMKLCLLFIPDLHAFGNLFMQKRGI